MALDVIDAHRLGDSGHLVEIARVIPQTRIVGDAPQVALEMAVVHAVEPYQRGEQPPVRFGNLSLNQIALPREPLLELIESLENAVGGFLVCVLARRETGAIHTIIDIWINELVDGIDFAPQRGRIV